MSRARDYVWAAMVVALASIAAPVSAQRAVAFFSGRTQGTINGESTLAGYENWHDVTLIRQEVITPRDVASGLPTGRRQHKPVRLRMPVSEGAPGLLSALTQNESLQSVQIVAFSGTGETLYTIDLMNARVSSYRSTWSQRDGQAVYEVELTYQRITWTSRDGLTTTDDWETIVVMRSPIDRARRVA